MEPWRNHYSVLRQSDRDHPIQALQEICNRTSLFNQRYDLFEFYRAGTQSEAWEDDDPERKSDRLFFYETTLYLYEIAYRIRELIKDKQLSYIYHEQKDSSI